MIVAYRVQNGWLVGRYEKNAPIYGCLDVVKDLPNFLVFDSLKAMTDHFSHKAKPGKSKRATDSAARGKGARRKR